MFSVVIPTMWRYDPFIKFLYDLVEVNEVDEIILIDNDNSRTPNDEILKHQKIKRTSSGENLFVNPSWNLGVELSRNENILILNDDVIFDTKIFKKIEPVMESPNFGVAGAHPGEQKLNQIPFRDGLIDILPWQAPPVGGEGYLFGFGTMFFVKKSRWFKIPADLLIYYGDDWVHLTQDTFDREIYLITNIFYHSPSAQTCTNLMTEDERNHILYTENELYRNHVAIFRDGAYQGYIESEYQAACQIPSDINEHIPTLRQLASECESVVELGVREGWSTRAFLTQRNKLRSYDIVMWPYVTHLFNTMKNIGRDFNYIHANSLEVELEECDMIFFDTEHTYNQLSNELRLHGNKAQKYLVFHDTESYKAALMPAIREFVSANPHWETKKHYYNNNGLLVLERNDG